MKTDFWLSKLCFDLQDPVLAAAYRAERRKVLDNYPLKPDVCAALETDDVAFLAGRVNPYLLRFYFFNSGMPDEIFMSRLHAIGAAAAEHGHG